MRLSDKQLNDLVFLVKNEAPIRSKDLKFETVQRIRKTRGSNKPKRSQQFNNQYKELKCI